jgi:hypothetical protein
LVPAAWALVAALLAVIPAQAAGVDQSNTPPPRASIATLSTTTLAKLQQSTTAQPPAADAGSPGSFFKTKKGVAVLALIGAGFGYTLYSKNHDRVLSPIR